MARRKNVKRIDPRYFLEETVNRGEEEKEPGVGGQPPEWERKLAKSDPRGPTARSASRHVRRLEDPDVDVEELEEGCPLEDEGEAIDISGPGVELHVDDISQLPPEEAFAAGLAAAQDAIDQLMGGPEDMPPEGGGALQEIEYDPRGRHVVPTPGAASPQMVEWMTKHMDDLQASLDSLGERRVSALNHILRLDLGEAGADAEEALKRQKHSLESAQKTMEFLRETVPASRFEEE